MEVVEVKICWNLKSSKYYNVVFYFLWPMFKINKNKKKTITRNQFCMYVFYSLFH